MRRQSAISTPLLRTYPLQIHPALPPSSATPHLRSEACFVIHTHTHTPFQPIFDPAVHTHPAHLPLPASTSEALANPPSTHSPSFSSRRASRNLKGLAWIMPMTKRAAGVSWLWPGSRPCFEHNFSVRACALSRNSVCPARTFEESKSRAQAGERLCFEEAASGSTKKTQTTNHDPKKTQQKTQKTQTTNHDHKKTQQKTQKKKNTQKTQTTNHDHKKNTTKNTNYQSRPQKKHNKKHKLPIRTTKKKHKNNTQKTQTTNHDHKKSTKKTQTTNHDHKKSTTKSTKKSTNYKSRLRTSKFP